jgi:hypothetical protein
LANAILRNEANKSFVFSLLVHEGFRRTRFGQPYNLASPTPDSRVRERISQVCERLLSEGVAYKKEGPKFMQRLVAKQKARVKDLT